MIFCTLLDAFLNPYYYDFCSYLQVFPTRTNSTDLKRHTGVYKISCSDCNKFYIGQTGRSFETRFKEHLPRNNNKSNFSEHLISNNHSYSSLEENLKPLHLCNKGRTMTTLEQYEIYKATKTSPQDLLNDKNTLQANILFESIIKVDGTHRRGDQDSRRSRVSWHQDSTGTVNDQISRARRGHARTRAKC